jgi:hypothetical protein
MYIFEAEISSEVLEMLDKPTIRAEYTTWPTVLCRTIPFKPYDSFQLRIMAEVLGSHPERRNDALETYNVNKQGRKRRPVEDGGNRNVRQKM